MFTQIGVLRLNRMEEEEGGVVLFDLSEEPE